jgi:hypothetical protein
MRPINELLQVCIDNIDIIIWDPNGGYYYYFSNRKGGLCNLVFELWKNMGLINRTEFYAIKQYFSENLPPVKYSLFGSSEISTGYCWKPGQKTWRLKWLKKQQTAFLKEMKSKSK